MTPRGISLPSLLGLLDLYRLTAADTAKHDTRRLTLTGSKSYAQLVWGHLCANFTDPAIRLAALFALRYPRAFRTVNSIALLASYEDDAAKPIWSILKREGIVSGTQDAEYDIPALLGHTDTDIVIATIRALGERLHQFPESVHAVNNLLRHTNSYIIIKTIHTLGERLHQFPESVHAVNKLLRHTNMDIVIRTINALGERLHEFPEAVNNLLGHDTNTYIVIETIRALGERLHEFTEAVNKLLGHTNTDIVIATIRALGERLHQFPEAVNNLLGHTNENIVIATIR